MLDCIRANPNKKGSDASLSDHLGFGAGDESRTRDLNLGKVALYQLSYSRIELYRLPGCAMRHATGH